jgi:hypothetical protein
MDIGGKMKKSERDDLLDLMASIMEAIDFCRTNEVDVETRNTFHNDFSEAFGAVYNQLEEYCKIYDLSGFEINMKSLLMAIQDVLDLSELNFNEKYNEFFNIFLELSDKMQNLEVSYEMVFLPYHASMWDSMESVWEEAKKDKNCIPYIIPIPYFYKDEKGNLSELQYDGDKFPKDIPITDYREYDIQEKKPEIIFFHNPYDNYNRVTTVHPDFYSDRLKMASRLLIYIPYFIFTDQIHDMYINLPGIKNADAVFLQSEEVAKRYEEVYLWEDKNKFYPVGSPKIDRAKKMKRLKKEELLVPNDWIVKAKGKKVVLFNTHLNNIINSGEEFMKKIQLVIDTFKKSENAILLWRPHPLSQATTTALNPAMYNKYLKIVEDFKAWGGGIYDEEPDFDTSLSFADAYYGDGSSLVKICYEIKMPVLLQNIEFNEEPSSLLKESINFEDACFCDNKMWFFSSFLNALFSKDLDTGIISFHGKVPGENDTERRLYSRINIVDSLIILTPFRAKNIAVYDIKSEEFKIYPVEGCINTDIKYYDSIVFEKDVYMFPLLSNKTIKFSLDTEKISHVDAINDAFRNEIKENEGLMTLGVLKSEKNIYIPSCIKPELHIYNLEKKSLETRKIKNCPNTFSSIEKIGNNLYIFPLNSADIIISDVENDSISKISIPKTEDMSTYYSTAVKDEKIYILDVAGNTLFCLDTKSQKIEKLFDFKEQSFYEKRYFFEIDRYVNIKIHNDELLVFPFGDKDFIKINLNTNDICYEVIRTKEISFERSYEIDENAMVLYENSYMDLEIYLDKVVNNRKETLIESEETIGSKIYHTII